MGEQMERPTSWRELSAGLQTDDYAYKKDWKIPVMVFQWGCEWVSYGLSRVALLEVLEYAGKLGILLAAITYIYPGCNERKQAGEDARSTKHYVAWQTINSAVGRPGNAGRTEALRDLIQDGVSLKGISLAGGVIISGPLDFTNAEMDLADLSAGEYKDINFSSTSFSDAAWDGARCIRCNFTGAIFSDSTLSNIDFLGCNLNKADFSGCDFLTNSNMFMLDFRIRKTPKPVRAPDIQGARFEYSSLVGADFTYSRWGSVSFYGCNLAHANLNGVVPSGDAYMSGCNLYGASNAWPQFLIFAYRQRVIFTNIDSQDKWMALIESKNKDVFSKNRGFFSWASNQFMAFQGTNDPELWHSWQRENFR